MVSKGFTGNTLDRHPTHLDLLKVCDSTVENPRVILEAIYGVLGIKTRPLADLHDQITLWFRLTKSMVRR